MLPATSLARCGISMSHKSVKLKQSVLVVKEPMVEYTAKIYTENSIALGKAPRRGERDDHSLAAEAGKLHKQVLPQPPWEPHPSNTQIG